MRMRGPKSLKPYEIILHLSKLDELDWNWRLEKSDMKTFIGNVLRLLKRSEDSIINVIGFPTIECDQCKLKISTRIRYLYEMDVTELYFEGSIWNLKDVVLHFLNKKLNSCCLSSFKFSDENGKYIVIEF